ncbi:hypothetical protein [Sphingomonas sp. 22R3R2A-7]|uniref:hypothetical protein n=1 Tax=Sphingomonas sp. 22R3R2A-7 TaxID=3050230 RepID=UPI002FE16503
MSLTPNQQGVGRLLRFLNNSYVLARQEANNDEFIRIAPVLLRALPRLMGRGEIGSIQTYSSVDRTKPRNLFGQTSYLQSDAAKGVSPVDGIEQWLDQEVQPGGTRRSLLEQADAYFGDGSDPFIVADRQPQIRSIRRFANEIARTGEIQAYAANWGD